MPYWSDVDHSDIDVQLLREEYPWLFGRLVHQPMTELNSAELALRVSRDDGHLKLIVVVVIGQPLHLPELMVA